MPLKPLTIRVTDAVRDKLDELRERRGFVTLNDTLIYCIIETHESEFNNYKELIKKREPREKLSVEEKMVRQVMREDTERTTKQKLILERGRSICALLDGQEINNGNGTYGCSYTMYEKVGRTVLTGKRIVPMDLLTDEHVTLQYKGGTKDEVHKTMEKENSLGAVIPQQPV